MRRVLLHGLVIALAVGCYPVQAPSSEGLSSFLVTVSGVFAPGKNGPQRLHTVVSTCAKKYGGDDAVPPEVRGTRECPYAMPRGEVQVVLAALALDHRGDPMPDFEGPVSFRAVPGDLTGDYASRWSKAKEGTATIVLRVAHLYGPVRFWAEDAPPQPIYVDGGMYSPPGGLPEEPSRTYATGLSPIVHFEEPTIAKLQIPDGFDNRSSPLVGQFITVGKQPESGETLVQSCELDPENDGQPSMMVVTGTDPSGFFVTDLTACKQLEETTDPVTGSTQVRVPEPADPRLAALGRPDAGYLPGTFGSMFVYNYSFPEGLDTGDLLFTLSGSIQEFTSTTQLTFPAWTVAERVRQKYEPKDWDIWLRRVKPVDLNLRICGLDNAARPFVTDTMCGHNRRNLKLESLESGLVRVRHLRFPEVFTQCDLNADGEVPFFCEARFSRGATPQFVATADLNGDKKTDVVSTNAVSANLSVLLRKGAGGFYDAVNFTAGDAPLMVVPADFNADGRIDLATIDEGIAVTVLMANNTGSFEFPASYGAGNGLRSLVAGDFNGDGKPDLATANGDDDSVSLLLNRGDGSFAPPALFPVPKETNGAAHTPSALGTADFNGDGQLDLAVASAAMGSVSVLLGNGEGALQAAGTFAAGAGPSALVTSDLDGDGRADVAVANPGASAVTVLLGRGDGTLASAQASPALGNPVALTTGDFNGDGKLDVAAADPTGDRVLVLLGKGDGTLISTLTFPAGTAPSSVAAADLDGDGFLDLAAASTGTHKVLVLHGNGDGTLQEAVALNPDPCPEHCEGDKPFCNPATRTCQADEWGWRDCAFGSGEIEDPILSKERLCNINCATGQGEFTGKRCSERSTYETFGQYVAEMPGPGPAEAGLDATLGTRMQTVAVSASSEAIATGYRAGTQVSIFCNADVRMKFGDASVLAGASDPQLAKNTLFEHTFVGTDTHVAFVADGPPPAGAQCWVAENTHTRINLVTKDAVPLLFPDCDPEDPDADKAEQCRFLRGATFDVVGHLRHLQPGRPRWAILPRDADDLCCHPGPGLSCPHPIKPCP